MIILIKMNFSKKVKSETCFFKAIMDFLVYKAYYLILVFLHFICFSM